VCGTRATLLEELANQGTAGGGLPSVGQHRGMVADGNWRREHREVVEGAGGEVNKHCGGKVELRNAALSPGGGRRQLAPTESSRAE
jgi:hypothetical protein